MCFPCGINVLPTATGWNFGLDLPRPEPASSDTAENAYVFERKVVLPHHDGTRSLGYIDLYKRGCFVLEAKQTGKELGGGAWGSAGADSKVNKIRHFHHQHHSLFANNVDPRHKPS